MADITDTAICITCELYKLPQYDTVRVKWLGLEVGYCLERENIAAMATAFDEGYNALHEDLQGWLDSWDRDMVPYLLRNAAVWADLTPANVTQALTDWAAQEVLEDEERASRVGEA